MEDPGHNSGCLSNTTKGLDRINFWVSRWYTHSKVRLFYIILSKESQNKYSLIPMQTNYGDILYQSSTVLPNDSRSLLCLTLVGHPFKREKKIL